MNSVGLICVHPRSSAAQIFCGYAEDCLDEPAPASPATFVMPSIAWASSFCALKTARLTFSIGEPMAPVGASFTFSDSIRAWISLSIALTMAWVCGVIVETLPIEDLFG